MEGEAARFLFQGAEITVKMTKDLAKGLANVVAFFMALAKREKLYGETSLKKMLKSGLALTIATLPKERAAEFLKLSKEYGLPFHSVQNEKTGAIDVMFKTKDMSKFNAIIDKMGIVKDDIKMQEFEVESVKESVKDNLEKNADKAKDAAQKTQEKAQDTVKKAADKFGKER